jgi:TM2 domain-containing membrane protein YozV
MQSFSDKPKNKTIATLLAVVLGGPGVHRFYLYGVRDFFAWNYVLAFLLFVVAQILAQSEHPLGIGVLAYFPAAILVGWIEAFVIGLTPDKQWDSLHNRGLSYQSQSGWQIKVLLVLALLGGIATVLASVIHLVRLIIKSGIVH